jgi:hypothetical protein
VVLFILLESKILANSRIDLTSSNNAISKDQPLESDDSPEAFERMRKWLSECRTEHPALIPRVSRLTKPFIAPICHDDDASATKLPTRVLDVGHEDANLVTLLITQDMHAQYFALSYQWGKMNEASWKTTRANLGDHIEGVQLSKLPKTFRDAIQITRELGARYLWIDSLCIIQGDSEDWSREAATMCDVYQNAQVTIAAAGATNPTEGCYVSKRTKQIPIAIECKRPKGDDRGVGEYGFIQIADTSLRESWIPSLQPLHRRAWVMQERILSQRVIYCTTGGYSFRCRRTGYTERYWGAPDVTAQKWRLILDQYVALDLTFESDRLPALQGLADAYGKEREDEYHFGVWQSEVNELLLWTTQSVVLPLKRSDGIPTWSWAAIPGIKTFGHSLYDTIMGHEAWKKRTIIEEAQFKLSKNGRLQVKSGTAGVRLSSLYLHRVSTTQRFFNTAEDKLWGTRRGEQLVYIFDNDNDGRVAIGIAALDDDQDKELSSVVTCIPLKHAGRNHHTNDALWINPDGEVDAGRLNAANQRILKPDVGSPQSIWWHQNVRVSSTKEVAETNFVSRNKSSTMGTDRMYIGLYWSHQSTTIQVFKEELELV